MMNALRIAILFCIFAVAVSFAEETNTLPATITVDGVTYENVRWGRVTPTTVSIFHKTGVASIPMEKLPPELQKQFRYDPKKAAEYQAAKVRAEQARRAKQAAQIEEYKRDKASQDEAEARAKWLESSAPSDWDDVETQALAAEISALQRELDSTPAFISHGRDGERIIGTNPHHWSLTDQIRAKKVLLKEKRRQLYLKEQGGKK